ncbi:hypothetical protein V4F45_000140 [Vibrio parahaemolyticus]|nr:hypothetical protein [Vibrio parahaemolyticus]
MTQLSVSPFFANWIIQSEGSSSVVVNDGVVNISSPVGDAAFIYIPVLAMPGDKIVFSGVVYCSSVQANASIRVTSPGSDNGNDYSHDIAETADEFSLSYTVGLDGQSPVYVYLKLGYTSSQSGSMTAYNPRVEVISSKLGTSRTIALAQIDVDSTSAEMATKWAHCGISNIDINGSDLEITLDNRAVTAGLSTQTNALPFFSCEIAFPKNLKLRSIIRSYDQYTRKVIVGFVDTTTGLIAPLPTTPERVLFSANIV